MVTEHSLSGEMRYRMLETIRQYARDRSVEAGDGDVVRQRHLAYFVNLVAQAAPEVYRSNQVFWLNKLEEELDNLRMALEWALVSDIESGLKIVAGYIYRFWVLRGTWRELGNWLAQLLPRYDRADSLHVQALALRSQCVVNTDGNFHEAHRIAEKSLEMARSLSDKSSEAFSLSILGGSCRVTSQRQSHSWKRVLLYIVSWETSSDKRSQSIRSRSIIPIWNVQRRMPGKGLRSIASWAIWRVLPPA
jgi:hypothetical protein